MTIVPQRLRRGSRSSRADDAFENYVGHGAAGFRRRLAVTAVVAVAAVVAVSIGLAVRQYHHAQRTALDDLRSRTVVAAAVVDAYFAGDVATLEAVAEAPSFVGLDRSRMEAYLRRLEPTNGRLFNAGVSWIDRRGLLKVTTAAPPSRPTSLADRSYFQRVVATGKPYVSGGLVGRASGEPVVVVAVPTRTANGRVSGVLAASVRLKSVRDRRATLDLGYAGIEIVDRNGRLLLSGLAPVRNADLLARLRRGASGVVTGTAGLGGTGDDVVAYATAALPGWRIVIDRSRSSVNAAARRSLVLQLGSVGAVAFLVFAMVALAVRRSRRDHELQESRARAWGELTRALAAAGTPDEVATALVTFLSAAFPYAMTVVVFDSIDGSRSTRISSPLSWRRVTADPRIMDEIARRAVERRQSVLLERVPALRPAIALSGRRLRSLHSLPMHGGDGEVIGGIALVRASEEPLEPGEWALYGSFAEQAAQALRRSRRSEHDHQVAIGLQRSLLPEALPEVAGVALAGHYRAGAEGVEVGGDWYDAVRRRDGILLLCVGDVIGRGIAAATLMGRLRDAFRAHAYEFGSPAEIVRRMLQHTADEEMMITLACAALDPFSGEVAYSCAGHPPPLLIDDAGAVTRLDDAGAPPLGVADPASIQEERLTVSGRATILLYSDGLIERRGRSIDEGIDVLGAVVAADPAKPIERMIAEVGAEIGPGSDDVAFLVARLTGEPMPFELEISASPAELSAVRRRLRTWLLHRRFEPAEAEEIVLAVGEACNNAVEHAYDDELGSVWIRVDEDGETLRATVRDRGRWRDGSSGEDRGRGIAIMRTLMDTAVVETSPEGSEAVLERRRRAAAPA